MANVMQEFIKENNFGEEMKKRFRAGKKIYKMKGKNNIKESSIVYSFTHKNNTFIVMRDDVYYINNVYMHTYFHLYIYLNKFQRYTIVMNLNHIDSVILYTMIENREKDIAYVYFIDEYAKNTLINDFKTYCSKCIYSTFDEDEDFISSFKDFFCNTLLDAIYNQKEEIIPLQVLVEVTDEIIIDKFKEYLESNIIIYAAISSKEFIIFEDNDSEYINDIKEKYGSYVKIIAPYDEN